METLPELLPLLIPLVIIQLILAVFALLDLSKRQKTRGPKWMWVLIIIFGQMIGPVAYFLAGRVDE
jgi:ABC-type transport system involved in cytochrome c biogenesis permease component